MASKLTAVVVNPTAKHTASIIFLHGLGDSGAGWSSVAHSAANTFPYAKWILPNAPKRSITVNMGARMPGWYDIISLERIGQGEDHSGMMQSCSQIQALIDAEMDLGIPNSRIILAGFSQGAAMSLLLGLTSSIKYGGIVALSGYLPLSGQIHTLAIGNKLATPIFMGHGTADPVVAHAYGKESFDLLKSMGYFITMQDYPGMGHSACDQELQDMTRFIKSRLE